MHYLRVCFLGQYDSFCCKTNVAWGVWQMPCDWKGLTRLLITKLIRLFTIYSIRTIPWGTSTEALWAGSLCLYSPVSKCWHINLTPLAYCDTLYWNSAWLKMGRKVHAIHVHLGGLGTFQKLVCLQRFLVSPQPFIKCMVDKVHHTLLNGVFYSPYTWWMGEKFTLSLISCFTIESQPISFSKVHYINNLSNC